MSKLSDCDISTGRFKINLCCVTYAFYDHENVNIIYLFLLTKSAQSIKATIYYELLLSLINKNLST